MGHSTLSFTLFEIEVPHYPLFSLLRQKIDVVLKKIVNFFGGPSPERSRLQMSKFYYNSICNRRFRIISNKGQKLQKPKKIILKNTYNEFEQPCLK